jgi:hypothetical protein
MVIQRRAEVLVHSQLPDEKVLGAKMLPCHDIAVAIRERVDKLGPETRVAFLPQGTADDSICRAIVKPKTITIRELRAAAAYPRSNGGP